jgi:hypothetical protein
MRNLSLVLAMCVGAWIATAQPGAAERLMENGERFTAVAVSPGGPGLQPGAGQFDLTLVVGGLVVGGWQLLSLGP